MADEFFAPPKLPETFAGRKAELDRLVSEVRGSARGFPDMPIVVTGPAGIGKTTLYRKLKEYGSAL